MIRPKRRTGAGRQRVVATLLTFALLFCAHAGLKGIPVPAFASGRAVIRELDALILERFTPPPPEAPATEDEEDLPDEPPDERVETVSFDDDVASAVEELGRRFGLDEEVAPPVAQRGGDGVEIPAGGIAAEAVSERFESLFGAAADVAVGRAGRSRATPPRDGAGGLGIGINERVVDTTPSEPETTVAAGPDVRVTTAAERTATDAADVAISEIEAERFDGSEADRLATWMRANPSPLPIGVRVHVNFQPSFLTAAVPVTADGRRWELFLMFNETLQELHIVLVDGERSVYMIDRGFQEQSRSLREGTVRRANGQIVAVDSRTAAASGERAREFYNVFLSWWERAKSDVRAP